MPKEILHSPLDHLLKTGQPGRINACLSFPSVFPNAYWPRVEKKMAVLSSTPDRLAKCAGNEHRGRADEPQLPGHPGMGPQGWHAPVFPDGAGW